MNPALPFLEPQGFQVKQENKTHFVFHSSQILLSRFFPLSMPSFTHCFSNFNVLQNHLEGLLKDRLLGITPRVFNFIDSGWDQRMYISDKFPLMLMLIPLVQRTHFEGHCALCFHISPLQSLGFLFPYQMLSDCLRKNKINCLYMQQYYQTSKMLCC